MRESAAALAWVWTAACSLAATWLSETAARRPGSDYRCGYRCGSRCGCRCWGSRRARRFDCLVVRRAERSGSAGGFQGRDYGGDAAMGGPRIPRRRSNCGRRASACPGEPWPRSLTARRVSVGEAQSELRGACNARRQ